MADKIILQLVNINKDFSKNIVLQDVNLSVIRGDIHGIVGENGAGKSTLMKILVGVYPFGQYTGDIIIDGKHEKFLSIKSSEMVGIEIVYQELELVNGLTVAENIFLGHEPMNGLVIDYNKMIDQTNQVFDSMGIEIPANAVIKNLGVGQKQMVSIAKVLVKNAKILILDEPTAALTEQETKTLFKILTRLKKKGVTCIYISHKLQEIKEICDRLTILRDGKSIITDDVINLTEEDIIKHMVGREISSRFPHFEKPPGEQLLSVQNLTVENRSGKKICEDISFEVRAGEILGISGLMGSGRTELLEAIYGVSSYVTKGQVIINGKLGIPKSPDESIKKGLALLTEDRKETGLVLCLNVLHNISLSSLKSVSNFGVIKTHKEIANANTYVDRMSVKIRSLMSLVNSLSGGNQQKVLLGKMLLNNPTILMLDEPTRGIDVGAKYEIYMIMNKLKEQGTAILMVSSELPEILGMADRIIVMKNGRLTGELKRQEADSERIMRLAAI